LVASSKNGIWPYGSRSGRLITTHFLRLKLVSSRQKQAN
jgi:hypothetical protein